MTRPTPGRASAASADPVLPAPRPRPDRRDPGSPDSILERLLIKVEALRREPPESRGSAAEELVDGFVNLAARLAAGDAQLPSQWAGASPPPPELPASGMDAEVTLAHAAMIDAEKALAAAEAAELVTHEAREAAARAVGEARKTFYDLARVRDLSRP